MKKYFRDTSNLISFALGLIPAFVFYVRKPVSTIPFWTLLVVISILCIFVWLLIKSRIDVSELSATHSIKIIECSHNFCLCKPNTLITDSSWVMFYESSGIYEAQIAFGNVKVITENGIAQIRVYPIDSKQDDILNYINDKKSTIIVRPTITTAAIQYIIDNDYMEV